jgi:hypothetical protein
MLDIEGVADACSANTIPSHFRGQRNGVRHNRKAFVYIRACPCSLAVHTKVYLRETSWPVHPSALLTRLLAALQKLPQCRILAYLSHTDNRNGYHFVDFIIRLDMLECLCVIDAYWTALAPWNLGFSRWARLRDMRIVGNLPTSFAPVSTRVERDQLPSLRSLKIQEIDGNWFTSLPLTSNTLHTLVLRDVSNIGGNVLLGFLCKHSQSLKRLCLSRIGIDVDTEDCFLDHIASISPNLSDLYVHRTSCISESIFSHIPSSLARISIGLYHNTVQTEGCLNMFHRVEIEGSSLRSFELTITKVEVGPSEDHNWVKVMEAAQRRGVMFSCI